MPVNKFSKAVLYDIARSGVLDGEEVTDVVANNFLDLALTGDVNEDVLIVKEKLQGDTVNPGGLLPLRLINGRMVSALNLRNLLTVRMQQIAKSMMGKGGRLTYQSGRLVDSSRVEPDIKNVDNNVSLYFRYMFNPYEVFDPEADVVSSNGHAMKARLATARRNPRELFTNALRKAAESILYKGYNLIIEQVGVTKR